MSRGIGLKMTNLARLARDRSILKEVKEDFFTGEVARGQRQENHYNY